MVIKQGMVTSYDNISLMLPSSARQPIKGSISYKRTKHFRIFETGVRWGDVLQIKVKEN